MEPQLERLQHGVLMSTALCLQTWTWIVTILDKNVEINITHEAVSVDDG